jgi:short-subunit dehydrogenase
MKTVDINGTLKYPDYYCVIIISIMYIFLTICVVLYILNKLFNRKTPTHLDSNSVIVITGAAQGIGRLTALELARRFKCKFIILDILEEKFKALTDELQALGSMATTYKCDLTSVENMNAVLSEIKIKAPQIDVLINNAGIVVPRNWDEQTYNHHLKTMAVNYLAPVHMTLSLKDNLKGHVVTIASVAALLRGLKLTSYCASKHAIYGFHNCLRVELVNEGNTKLTTSMVCPYAINTGFFEGFETRLNKVIPMLDEKFVAKVVADTVVNKEEIVFIPWYIGYLIKLGSLLPEYYVDRLMTWLDTSHYANNPGLKHA